MVSRSWLNAITFLERHSHAIRDIYTLNWIRQTRIYRNPIHCETLTANNRKGFNKVLISKIKSNYSSCNPFGKSDKKK